MAIRICEPPAGSRDVVWQHMQRRQAFNKVMAFDGGAALTAANDLPLGPSFRIYTATRDNFFERRFLSDAIETAWLYVIGSADAPRGLAELSTRSPKGRAQVEFASIYPRELATAVLNAVADAKVLNECGDYELRILRAPALSFLAVWLYGAENLLIPVSAPNGLDGRHLVTEAEILTALQPLAERRMRVSDVS